MFFIEMLNIVDFNWFITVLLGFVVFYIINYYKNYSSLPKGPFPLPLIGNILHFRGSVTDPPIVLKITEWAKKYGPIFTIWTGSKPIVVVNNYELNCEASLQKRHDFIDRSDFKMHELLRSGTQNIFSSSGPYWEALRKVAIFAIRKFQSSERLPEIISEAMDDAVELMLKSCGKAIDPIIYIDFMVCNIIALTAFGNKFDSIDDQVFKDAKRLNDDFYDLMGNGLVSDFIPWLRPLYYSKELNFKDMNNTTVRVTKNAFDEHRKTFTPGIIRDFSDCVLEAKEEAIRENYTRNKFLTEDNLFMIVNDLFIAGTDTTQTAMRWAILILANDQQIQQKIYEEIQTNIGQRIPTQDDKTLLPFTSAFYMEVLRYRPPTPMGIDHCSGVGSELGGHKIPKNTTVVFNIFAQNNDPKYWTQPEVFNPNRFLDSNGKLITGRSPSYATFGLGPRICPGEKLAQNNFFLMIVRLIQQLKLELTTGANSADLTPQNILVGLFPKDYQIVCHKRI